MDAPFKEILSNFIARIRYMWARLLKDYFFLNRRNWKWISSASLLVILLFVAGNLLFHSGSLNIWWMLVAGLIFAAIPLLYGGMIQAGIIVARSIPKHASWIIFAAGALFFIYFSGPIQGLFVLLFYLLVTFILIAGALSNISSNGWPRFPRRIKLLNIFILCIGVSNLVVAVYFLSYPGRPQGRIPDVGLHALHLADPLALPDPGQKGPYMFSTFTYGTGDDRHRKEFGEEVNVPSRTVDGRGFLAGWDRLPGRLRTAYWGFGPGELPLNGRVWMPEGKGPFPVVLIVHGNHLDREYSDDGYAYIGEHLASHGYLAASVDENFMNRGLTDFNHSLEEENDARGWLLLKHLELLRAWNRDSTSVFFRKANTGEVVLIGHSRGGEAAGVAAFFNELPYYPDDANERFDFNFGIRGVVAIAPVYGQYSPGNRPMPLSDINYLALQGSMDADLESYMGLHQFNAIRFNDTTYHFKAGLYILHANHGQFNSSWGVNDAGYPQGLLLNRRALIDAEDQQLAALVGITSFVKATIEQETGYVAFFRDYRTGREWLPETRYISQFADNRVDIIANFEEDMNLLTTSVGDLATICFEGLAAMYEEENELRKGMLGTKTAMIGWNNTGADAPGSYSIHFAQPLDLETHSYKALQFDVAVLDRYPGERMNVASSSEEHNARSVTELLPGKTYGQTTENADRKKPAKTVDLAPGKKNAAAKPTMVAKNAKTKVGAEPAGHAEETSRNTEELIPAQKAGAEPAVQDEGIKALIPAQKAGTEAEERKEAQEPTAEEPTGEEPIAEEPTAEEPTAEEPIEEEPIAEEPTGEEPIAEEPIAEEPTGEEPIAEDSTAEEPTAEDITAAEPTVEEAIGKEQAEKTGEPPAEADVKMPEKTGEQGPGAADEALAEDSEELNRGKTDGKEPNVAAAAPAADADHKQPVKKGGEVRRSLEDDDSGNMDEDEVSNPEEDSTNLNQDDAAGADANWFMMRNEEPGEVGFSIVLTDISGNTASVIISEHFPLVYPEKTMLYKLKIFDMEEEPEPVPQHVEIALHHFFSENPDFDSHHLTSIHFVFDRSADGMVSIDNIGFTNYK